MEAHVAEEFSLNPDGLFMGFQQKPHELTAHKLFTQTRSMAARWSVDNYNKFGVPIITTLGRKIEGLSIAQVERALGWFCWKNLKGNPKLYVYISICPPSVEVVYCSKQDVWLNIVNEENLY